MDCKYCIFSSSLIPMLLVNFRIFSLFLRICEVCCLLILSLSTKFVPLSPFSKPEIIQLLILYRENGLLSLHRHGCDLSF